MSHWLVLNRSCRGTEEGKRNRGVKERKGSERINSSKLVLSMHQFLKTSGRGMALKIIKTRSEKILPQIYLQHNLNQILVWDGEWNKRTVDRDYWLKHFSFAHRLEFPVQRGKAFCERPFLLHLWSKKKQEKAETILLHSDPKGSFPDRRFEEVAFGSLDMCLGWTQILKLNVESSFLISTKVEEAIFASGTFIGF